MRRFIPQAVLVVLIALLLAALARQLPHPSSVMTVQLLAINDFHGHLKPPSGSDGEVNGIASGGAEYLATHLKAAVARNPRTTIVAAGDLIGASPMLSGLFHDEPAIESLNLMKLAVASVGNHEFDEGIDEVRRMADGGCHPRDGCRDGDGFDGASFEYLSSNVVRLSDGQPLFPATTTLNLGGVTVGFIGATLETTGQIVPADVTRKVRFLDPVTTANTHAAQLKQQGADVIVLLIHEGGWQRGTADSPSTDINGCADLRGSIRSVVDHLAADIEIVISGHSHQFYNCRIGGRLVTSAGSFGRGLSHITIDFDRHTRRIVRSTAENRVVTRDVDRDARISRVIDKYAPLVEQIEKEVVGAVTAELLPEANMAGESPLGSLIADAQLAATSEPAQGNAVVAFMNSGGIRAGIAARPGGVTYGDLYAVQPFGNLLTVRTMSGEMIKRLLEQQFDNPSAGERKILQVSRGFTYTYRAGSPAGKRVDAGSIQLNGRPIRPGDRLRVAASDFIGNGGDGFTVFREGTDIVTTMPDIDALAAYFRARSPVAPPAAGRIQMGH